MDYTFELGLVVKERISFTSAGIEARRAGMLHFFPWPTVRGLSVGCSNGRRTLLIGHRPPGESLQAVRVDIGGATEELRRLEAFVRERHPHAWLGEGSMKQARALLGMSNDGIFSVAIGAFVVAITCLVAP